MDSGKIVISKSDLRDPRVEEIVMMEQAARRPMSAAERAPVETSLVLNPIFYTGVAGAVMAFLAWVLLEPMITKKFNATGKLVDESGVGLALLLPLTSALIGMGTGLIEGIMSRNFRKAGLCGGVGLGVGLVWGVVGMFLAGIVYTAIGVAGFMMFSDGGRPPRGLENLPAGMLFMQIVARSVAWTIVGLGMGVGQGIATWSRKLFVNGLVGGLIGGFLGGLLFDPIGMALDKVLGGTSGAPSRAIGLSVVGGMVGIFLGLVENLSKDAWFTMKSGPLRGKQFVIYNNPTVIGSSPKCDIYIFKDPAVEPRHAEVHQQGSKFELRDHDSPQGVFINGNRIKAKFLEKGDVIVIGESVLEFDQREKA